MKLAPKPAWRAVVIASMAMAQCGCDAMFYRRIEVRDPETAAFAIDGPSAQALVSIVRAYAVDSKLTCPDSNQLPFKCSHGSYRVSAQSAEHGITVCYFAWGAQFERRKFEGRIKHLEEVLVNRFGAGSVTSMRDQCP
ncbi:MAG: hypothetical protein ACJ8R9_25240 [Steroidobacteraceae bacterium]